MVSFDIAIICGGQIYAKTIKTEGQFCFRNLVSFDIPYAVHCGWRDHLWIIFPL